MPIESAEECDGYLDRNHCGGGFRDNAGAGVDLSRDGTLLGRSGTVWGDAPRTGERRKARADETPGGGPGRGENGQMCQKTQIPNRFTELSRFQSK